jgi:hypothetical protein
MRKILIALFMVVGFSFAVTQNADIIRVVRNGDQIKTYSPKVNSLVFCSTVRTFTGYGSTANRSVVVTLWDGTTANLLLRK